MRSSSKAMLCSKLAIATALVVGASPAAAQLAGTIGGGSTGINLGTSTNSTINVTAPQAVVDWTTTGTPSGGQVTFLGTGNSATFQSNSNFAVLNRVNASGNAIFMDGTINSLVNGQTGGTVYFYSSNGIVMGSNSVINVGSLGLTTSPISVDGSGNWMSGFGGASPSVTFGSSTPGSYIRTDSGSQLNANGFGNYVALVAPRIEHGGTIRTDGAAALVAASAATITFRTNNLYDIQVATGTGDADGIVVDGGTVERNSEVIGGDHRAYLVAVPANNAMTMLIGGGASLGFDIAGSAGVEGNTVVLSAGRGLFNGEVVSPPNVTASLSIDNAAFTSNVNASAVDTVTVASNNGVTSFSGSLDAAANSAVSIIATENDITIGTTLDADASTVGANAVGGDVTLAAHNGNTLSVGGNATLLANGNGFSAVGNGTNAGHGTGGTVLVQAATGGTLSVGGRLTAHADGLGGGHAFSNGAAGNGTGGLVLLLANNGGSTISVTGRTDLTADGTGGTANICQTCSIVGGSGTGGMVDVNGAVDDDGDAGVDNMMNFGGRLFMTAQGIGGAGDAGAGAGQGGEAYLSSADGAIININNQMFIFADGVGGNHLGSGTAGSGIGGTAGISSFWGPGGQINIISGINLAHVTAEGFGGDALLAGGQGGYAEGGSAFVHAPGAAVSVTGGLYVSAYALGGDANSGTGGDAIGGDSFVQASGPNLSVTAALFQRAEGMGGDGLAGGLGEGGFVNLLATNNATVTVNGASTLTAFGEGGEGGFGVGGAGGFGDGGSVTVAADLGGDIALYSLSIDAGGDGGAGSVGGSAIGGTANISAYSTSSIDINYQAFVNANGEGGTGYEGDGGSGEGGGITFLADGGIITVDDSLSLTAWGLGGDTEGPASAGGYAEGGSIDVGANAGGSLTTFSSFSASATAEGGDAFALDSIGGDALGGDVTLRSSGVGSTVDARFNVTLSAAGTGGGATGGECGVCGGGGGDGTGGDVVMQTLGGLGNRILLKGATSLIADGSGGTGFGGDAGNGQGGNATVTLNDNGVIDTDASLDLGASGLGGYQYDGGVAGNGVGGNAAIILQGVGSDLDVGGDLALLAQGRGGWVSGADGGVGGSATGGWARIYGTAGQADFHGAVLIDALALGGNAQLGTGGAAIGGRARLNADGADYHLFSAAEIIASAEGGDGMTGGNASPIANIAENSAGMFANNGGSIQIDGLATLNANSTGGAGANGGDGGDAQGGTAWVFADGSATGNGAISAAGFTVTADATGGDGGNAVGSVAGGGGGNATGGSAGVHAYNSESGTNSLVLGNTTILAGGTGGNGGTGGIGINGLAGGAGGQGTAGQAFALTDAGNTSLTASNLYVFAVGSGGDGGTGGFGSNGVGGAGGAGGLAQGGYVIVGMTSGAATETTDGVANITSLVAFSDSYGGDGGDGGFGAVATGVGGDGGDALRSHTELVVRGGTVTIGSAYLNVDMFGGTGGVGVGNGIDGDSFTPDVFVTVTNRLDDVSAGATLNVGTMNIHARAHPSSGVNQGQATVLGGHQLVVENSDANFGSYSATVSGDVVAGDSDSSRIVVVNGDVSVTNGFTLTTDGELSVHLDGGTLTAGSFALNAGDFIDDDDVNAPAAIGTISANTISLLSGGDLILDANLDSGGALLIDVVGDVITGDVEASGQITIDALGSILTGDIDGSAVYLFSGGLTDVGDVTAAGLIYGEVGSFDGGALSGGAITLIADTTVATGNLTSTVGGIGVDATGSVLLSDINSADFFFADTDVNLQTGNLNLSGSADVDIGGNLTTGTIVATSVDFDAGGNVDIGNADVTEWLDVEAGGSLLARNVIAGDEINLGSVLGLTAGNLSVGIVNPSTGAIGYESNVGVISETSVQVGNVEALGWVALASLGTINAASIASGDDVLLTAEGNITVTGGITAGADSRLLVVGLETALLGEGATEEDEFDRSLVFAAVDAGDAVATGGSVTIGGQTNAGQADIFAGANFSSGAINARDYVEIDAGGNLTTSAVTAGRAIELVADGALVTGNLSAGIVNPVAQATDYGVGLRSLTSIQTGTIASADFVGMASGGSISANAISAGGDVIALADTNASFGAITTGGQGRLLIAGFDMLPAAGGYDNPSEALLFQAVDNGNGIATGGSVTIGGSVNTPQADLLAGGGLTTAAITADTVFARAGGTATLNGLWNVGQTYLRSNDIAIGASGGITGFDILLASTNATQTLIGDGLNGLGYALSNAEFGRLNGDLLQVYGNSGSSAAIDTVIGDLTLTAPGSFGYIGLGTVNSGVTAPDGTVRVVGSVIGNGFGAENYVSIDGDRVEVDAETATIALGGPQGAPLGGVLILDANQVHIAEASILDALADDPNYTGRNQDLATPTSVERPDGVIRANEIYVNFSESEGQATGDYTLLMQNVGTQGTPAGFVANYAEVGDSESSPAGSIDMVVYGQLVTPEGTLTGEDVRDALVEGEDLTRFTATSTINGCALSGNCIIRLDPPPVEPTPDLAAKIVLIAAPTSDDQPFGNEETIEDNEEEGGEDSASSPIQPPAPLFNTRPLDVAGDTDEPVSGGGNPALTGNDANPADDGEDDDEEDE